MRDETMFTPLIPFAPHERSGAGLVQRLKDALRAPSRWWDDRRAREQLAEMSEREWHDIGAGPRDEGAGYENEDTAEERAERRLAVRAWYRDVHNAHNEKAVHAKAA